jgi:hypothetical protein
VTDGKKFIAQIMFFSHKKSLNVKISNTFYSFFSSRNQYFPHIPYVASKMGEFFEERKKSNLDIIVIDQLIMFPV